MWNHQVFYSSICWLCCVLLDHCAVNPPYLQIHCTGGSNTGGSQIRHRHDRVIGITQCSSAAFSDLNKNTKKQKQKKTKNIFWLFCVLLATCAVKLPWPAASPHSRPVIHHGITKGISPWLRMGSPKRLHHDDVLELSEFGKQVVFYWGKLVFFNTVFMPSHYLNQCCNIVNLTLGNKLQWNLNRN